MSDVLGGKAERSVGYTLRVGGKGSGVDDRRNWDRYYVDGVPRTITLEEAKMMQGFPASFEFPVSRAEAMKQLGNSVAVPAVRDWAEAIIQALLRPAKV
jgi:DNA (cytosine-5)-methyltransferase 1